MKIRDIITLLKYVENHVSQPVRYIECFSADAIRVVLDDNSKILAEWHNGTDICLYFRKSEKVTDDDKRQTGYGSDADE